MTLSCSSVGHATPQTDTPGTVHIVDDDYAVRSAISLLGYSMGWQVYSYDSAREFLATYRAAEGDCLVLDLRMPGMSGVELLEELVRQGIHIPSVVITAYGDDQLARRARVAGAGAILSKPFRNEALIEHIKRALASSTTG
jgi:two-component system response regulator FixJ